MITKEEVQVLQEVIAKQCVLAVPYAVAEAALYVVEKYWLERMEDSMAKWAAGATCDLANPDPRSLTVTESASGREAAAPSKKGRRQHSRRPDRQHSRRPDRSAQALLVA
jgi:hypothetical protein